MRRAQANPPLTVVQQQPMHGLRTGTDNIPVLSQLAQPGSAMQSPHSVHSVQTPQQHHSYEGLNTPSVWRTNRTHAAAKVDALASNGMDEIEIPAFLRKQAD